MNRDRLLERQYQLLSCLVDGGVDPEGISARRLRIVSRGLACKRRREAISSWPALTQLGNQAELWFDEYAGSHRRPAGGSPLLDGYSFSLWLAGRGVPAAIGIVSQCRPYGQSVVARPPWERHWLRLHYALALWFQKHPGQTRSGTLPAPT